MTRNKKHKKMQKKPLGARLFGLFAALCLIAAGGVGGYLIWESTRPADAVEAPVPEEDFVDTSGEITGPAEAEIEGAAFGPQDMSPSSMLIPALGAYSPVDGEDGFEASKYADFDSMVIPADNSRSGWYSPGGPLYGGDEGTTLIASHVTSIGYGWGVLKDLWSLQGGELIYTKDADGNVQTWRVTEMRTEYHTDFPQDYWDADGVRRLVVTTCGGGLTQWGTYQYNIFVIAEPVDPKPRTQAQRLADSLPELAPQLLSLTERTEESGEPGPDGSTEEGTAEGTVE